MYNVGDKVEAAARQIVDAYFTTDKKDSIQQFAKAQCNRAHEHTNDAHECPVCRKIMVRAVQIHMLKQH